MSANNTIAEAADILAAQAEELRIGSTYEGDWQDECEAKTDYERMMHLARRLRAIEVGIPDYLIPYLCAAAFLAGYVVAKWMG